MSWLPADWMQIVELVGRYVHILCTTLLVGGTLFYEMVVPIAVDDLKQEHQLGVLGRARWVFKGIVWVSVLFLVASGIVSTRQHWLSYAEVETAPYVAPRFVRPSAATQGRALQQPSIPASELVRRPGWWWAAHASSGLIAALIAIYLTTSKRPPDNPIGWMRLNLVILMIVMFLATATRHMRLFQEGERRFIPTPYVTN